jgi:hypothetical protein
MGQVLTKPTKKKQYDVFACMPALGTVVINKLVNGREASAYGNGWISLVSIKGSPSRQQRIAAMLQGGKAQIVTKERPIVIAGTAGELWVSDVASFCSMYMLPGNSNRPDTPITPEYLKAKFKCPNAMVVDWFKARSMPDPRPYVAQFVPKTTRMPIVDTQGRVFTINEAGTQHGKGDFIVTPIAPNGQADDKNKSIVNGVVFPNMFSRAGWPSECIDLATTYHTVRKDELPKVVNIGPGVHGACELFAMYGMTGLMDESTKAKLFVKTKNPVYINSLGAACLFAWQDEKSARWHVSLQKADGGRRDYMTDGLIKQDIGSMVKFLDECAAYLKQGTTEASYYANVSRRDVDEALERFKDV